MSVQVATTDDIARAIDLLRRNPPVPVLAVNRTDAAKALGISVSGFDRLVRAGHISPVPHLSPARFSVAALESFVSAGASTPSGGRTAAASGGVDGPAGADGISSVSPLREAGDRPGSSSTAGGAVTPPAA